MKRVLGVKKRRVSRFPSDAEYMLGSRTPILLFAISLFFVATASLCPAAVHAVTPSVSLAGTFSDVTYHESIGDVTGTKVELVRGENGWFAFCQMWEGGPEDPVLVQVKRLGTSVEFDLPEDWGCLKHFRGRVTAKALIGSFSGGADCDDVKVALPRRRE
jgi:hypothetical protein